MREEVKNFVDFLARLDEDAWVGVSTPIDAGKCQAFDTMVHHTQ